MAKNDESVYYPIAAYVPWGERIAIAAIIAAIIIVCIMVPA
jgi:hypothetical protein